MIHGRNLEGVLNEVHLSSFGSNVYGCGEDGAVDASAPSVAAVFGNARIVETAHIDICGETACSENYSAFRPDGHGILAFFLHINAENVACQLFFADEGSYRRIGKYLNIA